MRQRLVDKIRSNCSAIVALFLMLSVISVIMINFIDGQNKELEVENLQLQEDMDIYEGVYFDLLAEYDTQYSMLKDMEKENRVDDATIVYLQARYDGVASTLDSLSQDWQSKEELESFLSNITVFPTVSYCKTRAASLQDLALQHGKRLNIQVITDEEVLAHYGSTDGTHHAICSAFIPSTKTIYYIEPVTMEVWVGGVWLE